MAKWRVEYLSLFEGWVIYKSYDSEIVAKREALRFRRVRPFTRVRILKPNGKYTLEV